MSDDFDFDLFDSSVRYLIAVGRATTIDTFTQDVKNIINDDEMRIAKIIPLDTDKERRRYVAIIVGDISDTDLRDLHDRFALKLYGSYDFETPNDVDEYITTEFGKQVWGEIQEFPITLDEAERYEIFTSLLSSGHLVLMRGTLDGEPVALISHPVHMGESSKNTTLAILVDPDMAKRITNPLA